MDMTIDSLPAQLRKIDEEYFDKNQRNEKISEAEIIKMKMKNKVAKNIV